MSRIVVIGGGLSGLSLMHYIKKFAQAHSKLSQLSRITLLDSNDYLGGSVKTKRHNDGVLHELGPRSVRLGMIKAQNTILMLDELGLSKETVFIKRESAASQNKYIYYQDQLHKAPTTFGSLFSKIPASNRRLYQSVIQDLKKPVLNLGPTKDISVYEFFRQRMGRDVAEFMVVPICRGISAGDARQLSMRSMFADILDGEQVYGSLMKAMLKPNVRSVERDPELDHEIRESARVIEIKKLRPIGWNLKNGLQSLAQRLCDSIMHDSQGKFEIYNQSPVQEARLKKDGTWAIKVSTVDGDLLELEADHLFACVPSTDLSKIIKFDESSNDGQQQQKRKEIVDTLSSIPHNPVACVCLEYDAQQLHQDGLPPQYNAFGYLTHPESDCRTLGVTFDSVTFKEHDAGLPIIRMTAMMGGAWFKQLFGDSPTNGQLEQAAFDDLKKVMKITAKPRRCHVELWRSGIANYPLGHSERIAQLRSSIYEQRVPLTLLGQSYDGIAVNDVIYSSRLTAHAYMFSGQSPSEDSSTTTTATNSY